MHVKIERNISEKFGDMHILCAEIVGVKVERKNAEIENFKGVVENEVRIKYELPTLKAHPLIRAYRNFFWRAGIDPTKVRPASEALIRRILSGKRMPTINTLVDAYNLASVVSLIPMGAFDRDKLGQALHLRFAEEGEEFLGIGMKKPLTLRGNELVISDGGRLIAIYPYRDAETTKITPSTKNVALLVCGVPDVKFEELENARKTAVQYITRFCGGTEV